MLELGNSDMIFKIFDSKCDSVGITLSISYKLKAVALVTMCCTLLPGCDKARSRDDFVFACLQ